MYVGTLQPRKNLVRLIEAFISVNSRQQTVNGKKKLKLVIAGKKGWMYEEIFKKVKELNLEKEVVFTGYVPDEELPVLYKGAACFVLVSLYEGFGLPVLEAFKCGCQVLTSRGSPMEEITDGLAIYADSGDVDSIANGMKKIVSWSGDREKLIAKANEFTWEKTAREILLVFSDVVS